MGGKRTDIELQWLSSLHGIQSQHKLILLPKIGLAFLHKAAFNTIIIQYKRTEGCSQDITRVHERKPQSPEASPKSWRLQSLLFQIIVKTGKDLGCGSSHSIALRGREEKGQPFYIGGKAPQILDLPPSFAHSIAQVVD